MESVGSFQDNVKVTVNRHTGRCSMGCQCEVVVVSDVAMSFPQYLRTVLEASLLSLFRKKSSMKLMMTTLMSFRS